MKKTEICLKCDCGEESLVVTKDEDYGFELCIFTRQFESYGFWNRLRLIWRIIRHGKPYTDQIIIDTKKAKQLAKFLGE